MTDAATGSFGRAVAACSGTPSILNLSYATQRLPGGFGSACARSSLIGSETPGAPLSDELTRIDQEALASRRDRDAAEHFCDEIEARRGMAKAILADISYDCAAAEWKVTGVRTPLKKLGFGPSRQRGAVRMVWYWEAEVVLPACSLKAVYSVRGGRTVPNAPQFVDARCELDSAGKNPGAIWGWSNQLEDRSSSAGIWFRADAR